MKVYPDNYIAYSELAGTFAFFAGPFSLFMTGWIVDYFGKKTELIVPIVCIAKSIVTIPFNMLLYSQQDSFFLSMAGLWGEMYIGRGWGSSATFMLRNVVDPKINYLGVSLFLIL